ncbi:hypothetical protein PIB30_096312, partial [Stylosanthes scabra]|nr:hypothetical protein [Stylosanthes scabra]
VHMSGRGRGSSQSSRSRDRGRGRSAASSEPAATTSPSTSTPGVSQLHADSSHASQPDPPTQQVERIPITWYGQKGFDPDNNVCTQAISDVIELMLNEPWINYSEVLADGQKRWYEKWAEGFTWPAEEEKEIRKAFDYRAGRRY